MGGRRQWSQCTEYACNKRARARLVIIISTLLYYEDRNMFILSHNTQITSDSTSQKVINQFHHDNRSILYYSISPTHNVTSDRTHSQTGSLVVKHFHHGRHLAVPTDCIAIASYISQLIQLQLELTYLDLSLEFTCILCAKCNQILHMTLPFYTLLPHVHRFASVHSFQGFCTFKESQRSNLTTERQDV